MLKVKSLKIENFRQFQKGAEIVIGDYLTLIVGQNATSKSTLLGMICQPFEFDAPKKVYTTAYDGIVKKETLTISKKLFQSEFSDVFRLSPKYDNPDVNKYCYYINLDADGKETSIVVQSNSRKDQKVNNVRFVVGKTRRKGEGNYPHPVIYLGLSRLYPLANSNAVEMFADYEMSDAERDYYSHWQKTITILNEEVKPEFVHSDTKDFLGCRTSKYDAETNSAGQDNLGQIISSVISFMRLKEKLGVNYQGGILLIDELDATFHILAQEKLVEFLIAASKEIGLQIICTTHSRDIIEACCRRHKEFSTVVSLYRRDDTVLVENVATYEAIMAEMTAIPLLDIHAKTTVLFEDSTAATFFKYLTRNKLSNIIHIFSTEENNAETSLPADILLRLASKRIPEFNKMVFVIDADQKDNIKSKHKHIVALPGQFALEKEMYSFLKTLDATDDFWSSKLGGYNRQMCFRDYPDIKEDSDIRQYKAWFSEQKKYWGRGNVYLYKRWIHNNKTCVTDFIKEFAKAYGQATSKQIDKGILSTIFESIERI